MSRHAPRAKRIISIVIDSTNFEATNLETTPLERTPPALTDLLTVFKALSDPTRLAIVEHLATGQHCVCELQTALELPANLLSHHLRVLREAGVVRDQRRGRWIDYALEPSVLHSLQRALEQCYASTSSPQTATTNTACASPEEVAS